MEQGQLTNKDYVGYDYKVVKTEEQMLSLCIDSYQCFGWKVDESRNGGFDEKENILYLKRNRKIVNKQELTRLQRNFEDCMEQIKRLERAKTTKATMASMTIGIVGTAFMAGSVFAVTASPPIIWLCILLAIPAFIGWATPIILYRYLVDKNNRELTPLIENKYEEINLICEKGNRLL